MIPIIGLGESSRKATLRIWIGSSIGENKTSAHNKFGEICHNGNGNIGTS